MTTLLLKFDPKVFFLGRTSNARCDLLRSWQMAGGRKDGMWYPTRLEGKQLLRQAVREGDLRETIDTYLPGRKRQILFNIVG